MRICVKSQTNVWHYSGHRYINIIKILHCFRILIGEELTNGFRAKGNMHLASTLALTHVSLSSLSLSSCPPLKIRSSTANEVSVGSSHSADAIMSSVNSRAPIVKIVHRVLRETREGFQRWRLRERRKRKKKENHGAENIYPATRTYVLCDFDARSQRYTLIARRVAISCAKWQAYAGCDY